MPLVIKRVSVRNWSTIRSAVVEFPRSGFVAVTGPVGSGKTSLGEVVAQTVFGFTERGGVGRCSTGGEGDTYALVEAELDGRALTVELGYKCAELSATGERLRFTFGDDQPVSRARIADTRRELSALVRVDPVCVPWTILLDGQAIRFDTLDQADAVAVLMRTLDQPDWAAYGAAAGKRVEAAAARVAQAEYSVARLRSEHAEALALHNEATFTHNAEVTRLKAANEAYSTAQAADQSDVTAAEEKFDMVMRAVATTKRELKLAETQGADELARLDQQRLELESTRCEAKANADAWRADGTTARRDAAALKAPDVVCHTCGQRWTDAEARAESARLVAEQRAALLAHEAECVTSAEAWTAEATRLGAERAAIETQISQLRAAAVPKLSAQLDILESQANKAQLAVQTALRRQGARVAPDSSAVSRTEAAVQHHAARLAQLAGALAAEELKLAEVQRDLSAAQYWVAAFNPRGIPNMVLERVIPGMNETAARVIREMSGASDIAVSFATTEDLANGNSRARLTTRVTNSRGAASHARSSKGEAGMINLAIAETQVMAGRVAQRVAWRWVDEVVNNQSSEDRARIYQYMRRQAALHGCLLCAVDHGHEVLAAADHILQVEKGEGGTAYSWR